jgi:hypothetical protein
LAEKKAGRFFEGDPAVSSGLQNTKLYGGVSFKKMMRANP